MKVTYSGPLPAVIVQGVRCNRGQSVDVPAALAKSLAEQDVWTEAKPPKSKPATEQEN